MNPSRNKLQQREQLTPQARLVSEPAHREFKTPEELLRHDAARTAVPDALASRLKETLNREGLPAPAVRTRPRWWRLFSPRS